LQVYRCTSPILSDKTQTRVLEELKDKKTDEFFLHHSSLTFSEFSSSLLLENGRKPTSQTFKLRG